MPRKVEPSKGTVWLGSLKEKITEIIKTEFLKKPDLPDKLVSIDTGKVVRYALQFIFSDPNRKQEFFSYLEEQLEEEE